MAGSAAAYLSTSLFAAARFGGRNKSVTNTNAACFAYRRIVRQSVADERLIEEAARRTRMVTMGPQSLLLKGGLPLDIDLLLGRGHGPSAAAEGKVRVSVIYLNMLPGERERQFFLGQLAQALYRWMLRHPSPTPQALFYIDEIAPFLPPVRKHCS